MLKPPGEARAGATAVPGSGIYLFIHSLISPKKSIGDRVLHSCLITYSNR